MKQTSVEHTERSQLIPGVRPTTGSAMRVTVPRVAVLVAAIITLSSGDARADIGLPMVAVYLPPAWLCFIPIVIVEAYVGITRFKLPPRRALVAQAVANGLSTGVGIPLTWIILAVMQLNCCGGALGLDSLTRRAYAVTIQAPWLIPYEDDLRWMVPVAFISLTIPFYAMSVASEYLVVRRFFPELANRVVWAWVRRANIWSYGLLIAVMLLGTAWPAPFEWASSALAPLTRAIFGLVFRIIRGQPLPF
jgi:hypothetical protein